MFIRSIVAFLIVLFNMSVSHAQPLSPQFRVISFFTARHDPAHISFVGEANTWFAGKAREFKFVYDTTTNWDNLSAGFLRQYDVVIFLDTRPEKAGHRDAFRQYMEAGGAWLGFHFAAFALKGSDYPDNWAWYHNEFIGAGQYRSNTWRPTAENLRVWSSHPVCKTVPPVFMSSPNEWYKWEFDLRKNPDIDILLALDENTFPVGTGPKQHEIWYSGFYPVAWTNKRFRMIYINMGHNDMDYEGDGKALSSTFASEHQAEFILQSLIWLGDKRH